jgi:branched-chain amino acid transport system substrate-binding protein
VDNERHLSNEFHIALDAVLPPAPWLEAAVRQHLRRERSRRRPADRVSIRLPRNVQRVAAVLLLIVLAATAMGVFLLAHHAFLVPAGPKGTIEIGSDMPTSGADASNGLPIQYGEAFAVAKAGSVRGFTLKFVPYDDAVNGAHDPTKGAENVLLMIARPNLLGFVGPFHGGVAAAEIPVANQAGLAMISPATHDDCLTIAFDYCQSDYRYTPASLRPTGKNTFFRIAAADAFQGPAIADFAYDELGLRRIAVWDNMERVGIFAGVVAADTFTIEFTKKGGIVVARRGFDTSTGTAPDFHSWLKSAKAAGAQAIYAGAATATYGCVARAQSQDIFPADSYYFGPDWISGTNYGIADQQCITDAGAMANDHMYASVVVGDANLNPGAEATIAAYEKTHPDPADTNAFTFAGYDAAAILIDAIGRAIDANGGKMPTRQQVVDQLALTTNYQGVTGTYTFNAGGDPTTPTLQIQQNQGGTWTPIKNITVAGS